MSSTSVNSNTAAREVIVMLKDKNTQFIGNVRAHRLPTKEGSCYPGCVIGQLHAT